MPPSNSTFPYSEIETPPESDQIKAAPHGRASHFADQEGARVPA